ncbi:hypothetical protein [Bdellovibrio reynosensis]|uniref:PA14 domain-containing protein n=1 Tax=Bdellovibrio reynosensis TaxID=2835041 RepID=A0ABY4CBJ4_9BACT|nr:hypothetical protein [Bdellovibrio reynosensis]UOF01076.1 hypothetical protein MNR06_15350 [Bdellovibrio reynosensis]
MGKSLIILAVAFSLTAQAKNNSTDVRYKRGLLKGISCSFKGIKTETPANVGTFDFADPDESVCVPFFSAPSSQPENGLLGKLFLKTPAMPAKSTALDYYNHGQRLDQNLYFFDVNVPTRPFTDGFVTQSGQQLVDAQGNKLVENFGIEYTSVLQLGADDKEGMYELASISDDGARVFIKEGDKWNEIINNDGNHPTRLACGFRSIELTKQSKIPLKILYFQGPRYHVANVLIWKHKPNAKAKDWKDQAGKAFCGMTSNSFFGSEVHKKRISVMDILEKMGWKAISTANFKMPEQKQNPCTVEDLVISDYQMTNLNIPNATLTWKTNLPATSQIRIVNLYTGEEAFLTEDKTLVNEHTADISGLQSGVYYLVQAISKDAHGRSIRSGFIEIYP